MSKVLHELSYYLLTTDDSKAAADTIPEVVREYLADDPFCTQQLTVIDGCSKDLKESSQRTLSNKYTKTLEEADNLRDAAFKSFLGFVDGMAAVTVNPTIAEPALEIQQIIQKHGRDIPRLSYLRQSTNTKDLTTELQKKENQQKITAFMGNELFKNILTTQNEFDAVYNNKADEEAQKDYPLVKKVKVELHYRLEGLLSYLDRLIYDNLEKYDDLKEKLNERISNIMEPARARQTRAQNAEVEEPVAG
jgi:hypothetical protein